MKTILALFLLFLAGCASVQKVDTGKHTLGERLSMTLEGSWNHLDFPGLKPAQVWTMEGLFVDELLIYGGVTDGEQIHPTGPQSRGTDKSFKFRSTMQTEEMVAMFEGMLSRDGSVFKLVKLESASFGGKPGYRFEYELVRKTDNVRLRGIGFGAVDRGELFALLYQAPRFTFFDRYRPVVEKIAQTVKIGS